MEVNWRTFGEVEDDLVRFEVQTPKNQSNFVYFVLEASSGLCFYSTMPTEKSSPYRRIEVYVPKERSFELRETLKRIANDLNR